MGDQGLIRLLADASTDANDNYYKNIKSKASQEMLIESHQCAQVYAPIFGYVDDVQHPNPTFQILFRLILDCKSNDKIIIEDDIC